MICSKCGRLRCLVYGLCDDCTLGIYGELFPDILKNKEGVDKMKIHSVTLMVSSAEDRFFKYLRDNWDLSFGPLGYGSKTVVLLDDTIVEIAESASKFIDSPKDCDYRDCPVGEGCNRRFRSRCLKLLEALESLYYLWEVSDDVE